MKTIIILFCAVVVAAVCIVFRFSSTISEQERKEAKR